MLMTDDNCPDCCEPEPLTMAEMAESNCVDCRWNTLLLGEWYTVRNDIWKAAKMATMDGCLCIGCLEERLDRMLTPDDFVKSPINDPNLPNTSSRLRARLRGVRK